MRTLPGKSTKRHKARQKALVRALVHLRLRVVKCSMYNTYSCPPDNQGSLHNVDTHLWQSVKIYISSWVFFGYLFIFPIWKNAKRTQEERGQSTPMYQTSILKNYQLTEKFQLYTLPLCIIWKQIPDILSFYP